MAQEFFWTCKLDSKHKKNTWNLESNDDKLSHTLYLKQACLGTDFNKNENTVVEVSTTDFYKKKVTSVVVHLKNDTTTMVYIDQLFSSGVTFSLVSGKGPLYLTGIHFVEIKMDPTDEESEAESSAENTEDSENEVDEEKAKEVNGLGESDDSVASGNAEKEDEEVVSVQEFEEEEEEEESEDEEIKKSKRKRGPPKSNKKQKK